MSKKKTVWEKNIKRKYGRNRYHNISGEKKQIKRISKIILKLIRI